MTTLDDLIVAGVERGLDDAELLRLLLEYGEGEADSQTFERPLPPAHEQMVLGSFPEAASEPAS